MKKSFIVLNSKSIKKNTYKIQEYKGLNVFVPIGEIYIEDYFEKYGIDKDFRKVILLVEQRPLHCKFAQDYITERTFYLFFCRGNTRKIEVRGNARDSAMGNGVYFNDELKRIKRKSVIVFYRQLEELGLLENYLMAIKEFYGLQVSKKCDINELVRGKVGRK